KQQKNRNCHYQVCMSQQQRQYLPLDHVTMLCINNPLSCYRTHRRRKTVTTRTHRKKKNCHYQVCMSQQQRQYLPLDHVKILRINNPLSCYRTHRKKTNCHYHYVYSRTLQIGTRGVTQTPDGPNLYYLLAGYNQNKLIFLQPEHPIEAYTYCLNVLELWKWHTED
ncbi:hypothetical protein J6590_105058, partial [Homalodisca vitripennis]